MTPACPTPASQGLKPDEMVQDVTHLPSAPRVLPRLESLLSDPNSSMDEVVQLIRLDLGIATRVLQVANSAYYSKGNRCLTVDESVNRVGYDQVFDLVAYAVATQVLVRPLTVYGLEADDLWKRSVACACAADILAIHTGMDRNIAYTNGLLHAIGMVVINEWAARNAPALQFRLDDPLREASELERPFFGFNQAEVGAALLRLWDFPREMSEPVRWQYAPRFGAGHARQAHLLYVAKWLRTAVCTTRTPDYPGADALKVLSLSPELLKQMIRSVEERMDEIASLLEV
jgi:HD-like signal output (HDOD) protein